MRYLLLLIWIFPLSSSAQDINFAISMALDKSISTNEYEEIGALVENAIKDLSYSNVVTTREESDIVVGVTLMKYKDIYSISFVATLTDNAIDIFLNSTLVSFDTPDGIESIVTNWLEYKVVEPLLEKLSQ
jgi:hypothetical protein